MDFQITDIQKIAETYHYWRNPDAVNTKILLVFALSTPISKVAELEYVLTPGRYVGFAR